MNERKPLDIKYTKLQGSLFLKEEYYSGYTHWEGENIQGWTGSEYVVRSKVLRPNVWKHISSCKDYYQHNYNAY